MDLFEIIMSAIGAAVTALLPVVLKRLADWLAGKTRSEALHRAIERTEKVVQTVVLDVSQTYVDDLRAAKADGRLEKAEIAEANRRAMKRARVLLGSRGMAELKEALGDEAPELIEEILSSFMEAELAKQKRAEALEKRLAVDLEADPREAVDRFMERNPA